MLLAESSIQLVPDGTLLLHLLFVGLMVAVLSRTLLRPINQILRERERLISTQLEQARATAAAREEKLRRYQAELRRARTEGYHLLEQERVNALREQEEQLRSLKEELTEWVSEQLETTRRQEEQVRRELETQASTFGILISSQVLGRPTH
jgi:F-type H+-transporting ATPase subunit b